MCYFYSNLIKKVGITKTHTATLIEEMGRMRKKKSYINNVTL